MLHHQKIISIDIYGAKNTSENSMKLFNVQISLSLPDIEALVSLM